MILRTTKSIGESRLQWELMENNSQMRPMQEKSARV
jgi:hypothetical protein